tara:strand:- start:247 stop:447 length:201 start_codon:yes stop_codon:yes gene_type:complete
MRMEFRSFASILIGMCLIGVSVGFIIGYYFHSDFTSRYWIYLSSPIMGLGSGLVIYGTLYKRISDK